MKIINHGGYRLSIQRIDGVDFVQLSDRWGVVISFDSLFFPDEVIRQFQRLTNSTIEC